MTLVRKATPERLSALSDGVFAVLITVLVLDLRPPEFPSYKALLLLWPTWLSYGVSYLFIAIVWTNHHYLMPSATEATPALLWFNFAHLSSMSLLPLSPAWMAVSRFFLRGGFLSRKRDLQAAAESRTLLVSIVATAQARFELPQGDPQRLAALILALAHGAVDQALAGHLSASGKGGGDPEDPCDDLLNYLIQSAAPQGKETKVRHMTKANEGLPAGRGAPNHDAILAQRERPQDVKPASVTSVEMIGS
jgi:uncharacterized membrane protein